MAREIMLTTTDNPYDPFTEYDDWEHFDTVIKGYHTNEYLARIAVTSPLMNDAEYDEALENAIDEICKINITGNYRKVEKNT